MKLLAETTGQNNSFERASADRRAGFPALNQTKIFLERKEKQREQRWWEDRPTAYLGQDHSIGGSERRRRCAQFPVQEPHGVPFAVLAAE